MPFSWKGGSLHTELPDNKCGTICKKCSVGTCTKQFHSAMIPHISNRSADGCGHTWED